MRGEPPYRSPEEVVEREGGASVPSLGHMWQLRKALDFSSLKQKTPSKEELLQQQAAAEEEEQRRRWSSGGSGSSRGRIRAPIFLDDEDEDGEEGDGDEDAEYEATDVREAVPRRNLEQEWKERSSHSNDEAIIRESFFVGEGDEHIYEGEEGEEEEEYEEEGAVRRVSIARRDGAEALLREWEIRRKEYALQSAKQRTGPLEEGLERIQQSCGDVLSSLQQQNENYAHVIQQHLQEEMKAFEWLVEEKMRSLKLVEEQKQKKEAERLRLSRQILKEQQEAADRQKKAAAAAAKQREQQEQQQKQEQQKQALAAAERRKREEEEQQRAKEKAKEKEKEKEKEKQKGDMAVSSASVKTAPSQQKQTQQQQPQQPKGGSLLDIYESSLAKLAERAENLKTLWPPLSSKTPEAQQLTAMKKEYDKRIMLAVNQISADVQQVRTLIEDLYQVIRRASSVDSLHYFYCLDLLATKLVSTGDTVIHLHQSSAFPIAMVAVGLCVLLPELPSMLLQRFHKSCPYVLPIYLPRKQGQSDTEWLLAMGYQKKSSEASGVEPEESYQERMAGFVSLYAAILQTEHPQGNPLGLDQGWTWLARLLNMRPRRITPTITLAFLEVCGHALLKRYPNQLPKLLALMKREFVPMVEQAKNAHTPSVARLRIFIEECEASNSIPVPQGRDLS